MDYFIVGIMLPIHIISLVWLESQHIFNQQNPKFVIVGLNDTISLG